MAECFHCGAVNPVGVCYRCNVLVCPDESTRLRQFQCTTCGSASAAAGAVAHSNQATLNGLSRALVRSVLLPGEREEQLAWQTFNVLLTSGLRLRSPRHGTTWETASQIREATTEFRTQIERTLDTPGNDARRQEIIRERLGTEMLPGAGVFSEAEAAWQAGQLWRELDDLSKSTFALALLMLRGARPASWPLAMAVTLYSLDPVPEELPEHPWG